VGRPAEYIAEQAGITVPPGTRVLLAELAGVGRDYPLSIEKLCPVLSFYVVSDWREGCERCMQILRYGGMGHTMSIHSRNEDVILQFGLKKPAYRIVVNTPTTHGSIGLTTGLDPAMTLGCGGYGGNITSDNISPRHLLNIKRLAYEITPAVVRAEPSPVRSASGAPLPKVAAAVAVPRGIAAESLAQRIDQFLVSRGYTPPATQRAVATGGGGPDGGTAARQGVAVQAAPAPADLRSGDPQRAGGRSSDERGPAAAVAEKAAEFVCEEDVRQALRLGRKIVIGERSIVTPAARDLGEQHRLFVESGLRR
jgi:acetaldehyde dehydrogenase (acetylating)